MWNTMKSFVWKNVRSDLRMEKAETKKVFYTVDPQYQCFNDMHFECVKKVSETKEDADTKFAIRLENGLLIYAFQDEMNGFIRQHEADPIQLPVAWEEVGIVSIGAKSIEDAMDQFYGNKDNIARPEGEYACDSFDLAITAPTDAVYYNHPFRNPERKRNVPGENYLEDIGVVWSPGLGKADAKEGICPVCGSEELDYEGSGDLRNKRCGYKWQCTNCGTEGTDWFDLHFTNQEIAGDED